MLDFFLTQNLTNEEKEQISKMLGEPALYKKGELVYGEGNYKPAIGIVVSGKLCVKTAGDTDVTLRSLNVGETFGVSAVFSKNSEEFVSRIYAEKDSEILFLGEELLKEIFGRLPKTAENYIRLLSSKIEFLNKKIRLLSCKTAQQEVYEFLTSNCDENGVVASQNMSALSSSLGIGRSSLYRCIEQLEKQNLITKNGKEIKVIYYEKNI